MCYSHLLGVTLTLHFVHGDVLKVYCKRFALADKINQLLERAVALPNEAQEEGMIQKGVSFGSRIVTHKGKGPIHDFEEKRKTISSCRGNGDIYSHVIP